MLGEKVYNDSRENLDLLVDLTKQLNTKNDFIWKQAEELCNQFRSVAYAESKLTLLLDMIPMGMMITLNRIVTYANKRMEDISGYTKSELVGQSTRIFYENDEIWMQMGDAQKLKDDSKTPVHLRKKDGTKSDCVVRMTRILDDQPEKRDEFLIAIYMEDGPKTRDA